MSWGSSRSTSGDGVWKSEIYFDPEADSTTGADYHIKDDELKTKLSELIETSEEIEQIWVYSHKLFKIQLMQGLMFHAFVVFETNEWYWSIEKNSEGITIQRSKNKEFVKERYRRKKRNTPITRMSNDCGRMKLQDLIDWLYKEDELNYRYAPYPQCRNCQGFAKRIFDRFAKTKYCPLI